MCFHQFTCARKPQRWKIKINGLFFLQYQLFAQLVAWQLSTLKRSSKLVKLAFGCKICIFPPGPSWLWVGPCFFSFSDSQKIQQNVFFGNGMAWYVWWYCCRPLGAWQSPLCPSTQRVYQKDSKGFVSALAIILMSRVVHFFRYTTFLTLCAGHRLHPLFYLSIFPWSDKPSSKP